MAKKRLSKVDIELMKRDEIGRAYLEYNDKVGGEPFGFSEGTPYVEDLVKLYMECIQKDKTWQELLDVVGVRFDEIPEC